MTLDDGTDLEVRTAAYFQSKGYFVKRGVNLTSGSENSDITDIDVIAISFSNTLSEERIVIDCKDKDRSKPFERILWLVGLKEYAKGSRGIFVAPRIPLSAREFAVRGNIEVLDGTTINGQIETVRHIDYGYGSASIDLTTDIQKKWREVKKETREIYRSYIDMFSTIVDGHPVTNINRIFNFVNKVYNYRTQSPEVAWMKRIICYEGASLFSLMLARYASETKWLIKDDRDRILDRKLTFGDIDPAVVDRIMRVVGLEEEPTASPEYTSAIIEVIENNYNREAIMYMANYTDLYLFGHSILKSGGISEDPLYKDKFSVIELVAKELISAFAYATKIPNEYFIRRDTPSHI